MRYARRYSQHVSQYPDDCEGCVTTRITNFTVKAFTWPRVEEINREANIFERPRKASLCIFSWTFYMASIRLHMTVSPFQEKKMGCNSEKCGNTNTKMLL